MRPFLLLFILLAFRPGLAMAEYRVFLLKIETPPAAPGQPPQITTVESTLDPQQYPTYNLVPPNASIHYTDTWRCKGRTDDFKPYCRSPRAPAAVLTDGSTPPPEGATNAPVTPPQT